MEKARKLAQCACVALAWSCLSPGAVALSADPDFLPGVQVGTVGTTAVNEASGLAGSRANPDVLWTHNDSGDSARAFALNTQGTLLGTYNILGAGAVDWEDMTVGPGPLAGQQYLYLGDIGDNSANRGVSRPPIVVYRVAEPAVSAGQSPVNVNLTGAAAFTLSYPDGARDAETLMVDPLTGDLYVVSKREARSRVYRVPAAQLVDGATITMEFKAELDWGGTTGGDISPDGTEVLIRRYADAALWRRPGSGNLWDAFPGSPFAVPLRSEPQGEAIAFDAQGSGYFTVSEGTNQPIYYFERVPEPVAGLLLIAASPLLRRRRRR